uniref:Uncharacterized protein n=1 Tax=Dromaius novaehollandiae TaxID=8790 RepID=A0A8C4K569_DRONO
MIRPLGYALKSINNKEVQELLFRPCSKRITSFLTMVIRYG